MLFRSRMAEYAAAVCAGRPAFHVSLVIDVVPNCDCWDLNDSAMVPDVGFFASFDPVALDQACVDAVNAAPTIPGSLLADAEASRPDAPDPHDHIHTMNPNTSWQATLDQAVRVGLGTRDYELVKVG